MPVVLNILSSNNFENIFFVNSIHRSLTKLFLLAFLILQECLLFSWYCCPINRNCNTLVNFSSFSLHSHLVSGKCGSGNCIPPPPHRPQQSAAFGFDSTRRNGAFRLEATDFSLLFLDKIECWPFNLLHSI